jgi:hypothetical protein
MTIEELNYEVQECFFLQIDIALVGRYNKGTELFRSNRTAPICRKTFEDILATIEELKQEAESEQAEIEHAIVKLIPGIHSDFNKASVIIYGDGEISDMVEGWK